MKQNNINRDLLIKMMRNSDGFGDELIKPDVKSQYTSQSVTAFQSFDFLILLLQNFGRTDNSEILELALEKVKI